MIGGKNELEPLFSGLSYAKAIVELNPQLGLLLSFTLVINIAL
jgi:hypothetical protein